jgi:hypothetical protein
VRIATYITIALLAADQLYAMYLVDRPRKPKGVGETIVSVLYLGWIMFLLVYWMKRP